MIGRQVDGIIYATLAARSVTVPRDLFGQRVVLLNCVDPQADLPSVMPDDVMGGRVAAQALLDAGVDEAIYVVGEDPDDLVVAGPARLDGVRQTMSAAGLELAGTVACTWAVTPAYDAVSALLAGGVRPRGLICLNDRVAMGVYQALTEHGLGVPHDVAVVSFDGSELAGVAAAPPGLGGAALRRDGAAGGRDPARPRVRRPAPRRAADAARARWFPARRGARVDTARSVTRVTSLRIVRHVPAGEGVGQAWQQ